jgi:hypothetical protein
LPGDDKPHRNANQKEHMVRAADEIIKPIPKSDLHGCARILSNEIIAFDSSVPLSLSTAIW